jgi:hypothetical protein
MIVPALDLDHLRMGPVGVPTGGRRIVVTTQIPPSKAVVHDLEPGILFVGTEMALHPEILTVLIRQDRERLVQVQE